MSDEKRVNTAYVASMLRTIADAIEAGTCGRWNLDIENHCVDVSTAGYTHYVDNGERTVTFRCEIRR